MVIREKGGRGRKGWEKEKKRETTTQYEDEKIEEKRQKKIKIIDIETGSPKLLKCCGDQRDRRNRRKKSREKTKQYEEENIDGKRLKKIIYRKGVYSKYENRTTKTPENVVLIKERERGEKGKHQRRGDRKNKPILSESLKASIPDIKIVPPEPEKRCGDQRERSKRRGEE